MYVGPRKAIKSAEDLKEQTWTLHRLVGFPEKPPLTQCFSGLAKVSCRNLYDMSVFDCNSQCLKS